MKKILSIFLSVCLTFSMCTVSFAGNSSTESNNPYPVIFVKGFGGDICKDISTGSPQKIVQTKNIIASVPDILSALFSCFITKNYQRSAVKVNSAVNRICGGLGCDADGNPAADTGFIAANAEEQFTASEDYRFNMGENELLGDLRFEYDYRKDPKIIAEELNTFIQEIKILSGQAKVILACHSEGTCMACTYLSEYGYNDISGILFLSGGFQGLSFVSEIFTKQLDFADNADEFELFITTFLQFKEAGKYVIPLVKFLNKTNTLDRLLKGLDALIQNQFDFLLDGSLRDIFATMPALWTFVEPDSYEAAKKSLFGENIDNYAGLIEKTDYYHYCIQTKVPDIINNCIDNGVTVIICSGYGINAIPLGENKDNQSDFLIDTYNTSLGATCAAMGGKLTGEGKYISPDKVIDASTCLFRDYTWFFKYQEHNSWTEDYIAFINWVIHYEGQPTIYDSPDYPQFMELTDNGLVPVK